MYLVNDGSFEIKEESVPKFLELLVSQKLIEKEENADVTEFKGMAKIEVSEIYGDIDDALIALCDSCQKENVQLDGSFTYYGDYEGRYEISNNSFQEWSNEEYAVKEALKNERLISPAVKVELLDAVNQAKQHLDSAPDVYKTCLDKILALINDTTEKEYF